MNCYLSQLTKNPGSKARAKTRFAAKPARGLPGTAAFRETFFLVGVDL